MLAAAAAACCAPAFAQGQFDDMADNAVDKIKKALVVYDNKDSFVQKVRFAWMEQYQMASVQPCGANGSQFKKGASAFDHEFRRSWVGVNVNFNTGTEFHTWARVGGLPYRYTYRNGRTRKDYSYTDFFDIWVKQDISEVKGLSVKAGKIKPLFTTDYSTPSSALLCVERSIIGGQQYGLDSNWGVEMNYAPTKEDNVYLQLMANDRASASKNHKHSDRYGDGKGFKGEFGWEDKCFGIVGANHKYAVTESGYQKISAQYMHDFDNTYDNGTKSGANYYGANVKDAVSVGHEWKQGALTLISNVVVNFEMRNPKGSDNNNNLGWQLQPVYAVTPHCDLVMRYTGMTGHDACKLGGDRYITRHASTDTWVDSLHALYMGADFYLSAKNKNAAKVMLGAEYMHARNNGDTSYCGWEFTTALRWNF